MCVCVYMYIYTKCICIYIQCTFVSVHLHVHIYFKYSRVLHQILFINWGLLGPEQHQKKNWSMLCPFYSTQMHERTYTSHVSHMHGSCHKYDAASCFRAGVFVCTVTTIWVILLRTLSTSTHSLCMRIYVCVCVLRHKNLAAVWTRGMSEKTGEKTARKNHTASWIRRMSRSPWWSVPRLHRLPV